VITKIEALNFRSLKYISCPLDRFHILIGPNASGKTTFLNVFTFIQDALRDGVDKAISKYDDFRNMLFQQSGRKFEIAIEARIPEHLQSRFSSIVYPYIRYQISIGYGDDVIISDTAPWEVIAENVFLISSKYKGKSPLEIDAFPFMAPVPETILYRKGQQTLNLVISRDREQSRYYSEVATEKGKGWFPVIHIHPQRLAISNIPLDDKNLPVTTWFREFITNGLQRLVLDSQMISRSSPPGSTSSYKPDGSNLPWVIRDFKEKSPDNFRMWIQHLQTALPDIDDIDVVLREDIRHAILYVKYSTGVTLPSWVISDGTLRFIALSLIAYLPNNEGVYLIEEPENGIHPTAVDAVCKSLSSVYNAQVLLATHSPVVLNEANLHQILCFRKNPDGSTCVISGEDRPDLGNWQENADIGTLFVGGVL
jgi:predicted ATPase